MGDHPRIQSTDFIDALGAWYVARPGAENRDRIGFGFLMGANFNVFVDDQNSFRLIVAGTASREQPLEYAGITTATWQSTAVGATVETHFSVFSPALHVGVGLNPRAVLYGQGLSPEFELGVVARLSAVVEHFGLALNVSGGLRLTDIERSSFEAGLGVFLNLF
jgi:hypothetical protein